MNLSQLLTENVSRTGEYPLVRFKGNSITNADLDLAVNRAAAGLVELGVKPGDRVALVMGNSPEMIVSMFACFRLGAWAMPVVLSLKPSELERVLADARPTTIIAHRLFSETIIGPVRNTGSINYRIMVGRGPAPEGWIQWENWVVGQPAEFETRDCEPEEIALLLYTSGTTGDPKGVMLSHMNLYSNAVNSARSQDLTEGEVMLMVLPLNHSFGITTWLASLVYAMKVVLLPRFDTVEMLEAIQSHKVESAAMVPTMLAFILETPGREKYGLESLKRIVVGGAPLQLRLRERFEEAYPHVQILEAYGLTEASPGVTVTRPDLPIRARSVGQSVVNQEICIMSQEGKSLAAGQVGEVCTRGSHVMMGYYNRPKDTAAVIKDGWLHTGDAGYLDEDGYLYLTERIKDLIIRGGENVYPSDVERVIRDHPEVAEVAVVAVPDEVYGEEIAAVVVRKKGSQVSGPEIIDYCKERLAPFQVPKQIFFSPILPRTPMGKIRKKDLRDQFTGTVTHGGD